MTSTEWVADMEVEAAAEEKLVRFTVSQRLQHLVLLVSFAALVLTGLPQKFNEASLSVWIVNTLGGIDMTRFLHRIFACVFMGVSVAHVMDIVVSMATKRFRPTMVPTLQDFRDAIQMVQYCLGVSQRKPEFDRYDYRQKFEYWGIVYGGIIMIITGLFLWFPTYVTRVLPGEFVPAAKEAHSGEALLALLIIVIWHLYSVMFNPHHFPLDTVMFTGKLSKKRLLEEHPREFVRLVAEKKRAEAAQRAAEKAVPGAAVSPPPTHSSPEPPPTEGRGPRRVPKQRP